VPGGAHIGVSLPLSLGPKVKLLLIVGSRETKFRHSDDEIQKICKRSMAMLSQHQDLKDNGKTAHCTCQLRVSDAQLIEPGIRTDLQIKRHQNLSLSMTN
jgi:hypothetical protein